MKLSTRARYGTRLMVELGLRYGEGPVFLRDIAKKEDISEKYLSQIIIPLKSAGLVNSFRGARGGYVLAKSPSAITLKDIVGVLEGGFNLVDCVNDEAACGRVSICVTRDLWKKLTHVISETLEDVMLEDLVKQCKNRKGEVINYNI